MWEISVISFPTITRILAIYAYVFIFLAISNTIRKVCKSVKSGHFRQIDLWSPATLEMNIIPLVGAHRGANRHLAKGAKLGICGSSPAILMAHLPLMLPLVMGITGNATNLWYRMVLFSFILMISD